jgi:MFS family permease
MSHIPRLRRRRPTPIPSLPWTLGIVSLGLFMTTLDNLVVTTALPSIRRSVGASMQSLEWTVNAYTLTFAVLLLTGAAFGDRLGRRRMFAVGLTVFTSPPPAPPRLSRPAPMR